MLDASDKMKGDPDIQVCNRSIKPHKVKPFLQVDGVSHGRGISLQSQGVSKNREKVHGSMKTGCDQQMPAYRGTCGSAFCSPYGSPTPSLGGPQSSRTYLSPSVQAASPNVHVKMPFKHSVHRIKNMEARWRVPSEKCKELTAVATFHMKQILDSYCADHVAQRTGRLQRGRLKPLNQVVITAPKIESCRGIMSETRSYCPSASRSLQRRRQIMSQMQAGDTVLYDSLLRGGRWSDSVHRVSAASSLDDVRLDEQEKERLDEDIDTGKEMYEFTMQQFHDEMLHQKQASPVAMGGNTQLLLQTVFSRKEGESNQSSIAFSTSRPVLSNKGNKFDLTAACPNLQSTETADTISKQIITTVNGKNTNMNMVEPPRHNLHTKRDERNIENDPKVLDEVIEVDDDALENASETPDVTIVERHLASGQQHMGFNQDQVCSLSCGSDVKNQVSCESSMPSEPAGNTAVWNTDLQLPKLRKIWRPVMGGVSSKPIQTAAVYLSVAGILNPMSTSDNQQMTEKREGDKNELKSICKPFDSCMPSCSKNVYENIDPQCGSGGESVTAGLLSRVGRTNIDDGTASPCSKWHMLHSVQDQTVCDGNVSLVGRTNIDDGTASPCSKWHMLHSVQDQTVCDGNVSLVGRTNIDDGTASPCSKSHMLHSMQDQTVCDGNAQLNIICKDSQKPSSNLFIEKGVEGTCRSELPISDRDVSETQSQVEDVSCGAEIEQHGSCSENDRNSKLLGNKNPELLDIKGEGTFHVSEDIHDTHKHAWLSALMVPESRTHSALREPKRHNLLKLLLDECKSHDESSESSEDTSSDFAPSPSDSGTGVCQGQALLNHCPPSSSGETRNDAKAFFTRKDDCEDTVADAGVCQDSLGRRSGATNVLSSHCSGSVYDITETQKEVVSRWSKVTQFSRSQKHICKQDGVAEQTPNYDCTIKRHRCSNVSIENRVVSPKSGCPEPASKQLGPNGLDSDGTRVKLSYLQLLRQFSVGMRGAVKSCDPEHENRYDVNISLITKIKENPLNEDRGRITSNIRGARKVRLNASLYKPVRLECVTLAKKEGLKCHLPQSPVCQKSRGTRHVFTHHSSEPFVCPSSDTLSLSVARYLKYGDSPYLKELHVKGHGCSRGKEKLGS